MDSYSRTCRRRNGNPFARYFRRLHQLSNHSFLLLVGELGEHRERKHLGGSLFGDREVTRTENQSVVGLREVKRDRVVNTRANAGGRERVLDTLSVRNPYHIEVIDRSGP